MPVLHNDEGTNNTETVIEICTKLESQYSLLLYFAD